MAHWTAAKIKSVCLWEVLGELQRPKGVMLNSERETRCLWTSFSMSLPLAEATEPVWRGAPLCGAGECLAQLLCLLAFPFAFAFSTQLLGEMLATQAQSPQKSASSAETTQRRGWVRGSHSPAGFGYQSSSRPYSVNTVLRTMGPQSLLWVLK